MRFLVIILLPLVCYGIEFSFEKSHDSASYEASNETIHKQASRSLLDLFERIFKPNSEQMSMLKPCVWRICSRPFSYKPTWKYGNPEIKQEIKALQEDENLLKFLKNHSKYLKHPFFGK